MCCLDTAPSQPSCSLPDSHRPWPCVWLGEVQSQGVGPESAGSVGAEDVFKPPDSSDGILPSAEPAVGATRTWSPHFPDCPVLVMHESKALQI